VRAAFITSIIARTPIRPASRRTAISAGVLMRRISQMMPQASRTSTCGKRSLRSWTNRTSRVGRPSQAPAEIVSMNFSSALNGV